MIDRILATLSLLMFLGFLGFLGIYIAKLNLWVVLVIVGGMATFDFIRTLRQDAEAGADGLSAHERAVQTLENQEDQAG
jgi:hypothetical protein